MVIRRVLDYVVRSTGAKLIPEAYQAFRKYDVRITNQLFGKSGGKGFRHGRDLGLILGEYTGDDLEDTQPLQPIRKITSRRKSQARGRNQRRGKRCNCKYYRRNQYR